MKDVDREHLVAAAIKNLEDNISKDNGEQCYLDEIAIPNVKNILVNPLERK